jgi:selenoprotein W-related protein
MSELEIEYCVPCGLLSAAEETEHALLSAFGERVEVLKLKPGHGGVFKVRLDGDVIFDKTHHGYDVEAIVDRVKRLLASEV